MVAYEARLNPAEAAADASLFDDETLSTEPEGMVGIRAGQARVSLGGSTVASLHPLADGKSRGRSPASKGRGSEASGNQDSWPEGIAGQSAARSPGVFLR